MITSNNNFVLVRQTSWTQQLDTIRRMHCLFMKASTFYYIQSLGRHMGQPANQLFSNEKTKHNNVAQNITSQQNIQHRHLARN